MEIEILDRISWRDYTIELLPDYDTGNPLRDGELPPTLVLHQQAERHFGWTTDKQWGVKLQNTLDRILVQGRVHNLHGPRGAMALLARWLRTAHGMRVVWPVSAIEHSGVAVYLGDGEHWSDPGGWDSGWIGWLLVGPAQLDGWGTSDQAEIEKAAKAHFDEFAAWVAGDVVGYRILDPQDTVIDECFGFYGSENFREPDGWVLTQCKDIVAADITDREAHRAVHLDHAQS